MDVKVLQIRISKTAIMQCLLFDALVNRSRIELCDQSYVKFEKIHFTPP